MIKLSGLENNTKIITENFSIYTAGEVKNDLQYFKDERLYTAIEYQAGIDARDMLENAIENECDNMYEDWNESNFQDIAEKDIQKLQVVLDEILNRNKDGNIAYYLGEEIDRFN